MKEFYLLILFIALSIAVGFLFSQKNNSSKNISFPENSDFSVESEVMDKIIVDNQKQDADNKVGKEIPLDKAKERVTKKSFGIFITPTNSPVQPEKFSGYHTGVDFEIFPDELEIDIEIRAICSGKLLEKRIASGYGGVVVQSCEFEGEPITVIYGHLKLESIKVAVGDDISAGEALGVLGKAYSIETSGERKHLHLGIHKGSKINILGYVTSKSALLNWMDPMLLLK